MHRIITEITPLSEKDCFYLVDRHKTDFDYPIHRHKEIEINFVCNCRGAVRYVGDSVEEVGDYDLVMVGSLLEHGWQNGSRKDKSDMREITVQFSADLLTEDFLSKNQMRTLKELMTKAQKGVAFGMETILKVYAALDQLTASQAGFTRLLMLYHLIYLLSVATDVKTLSSSSFAKSGTTFESRRVRKVEDYISANYSKSLTLNEISSLVGMTPTSFSRFFKMRTGRTLSDYVIDIRLGHAARMLVDTQMTCSEICYQCGFNNISNFNRLFKKKKGCSPNSFRDNYYKTKLLI